MKRLFYILFCGVHMNLRFPYMLHGLLMLITPKCLYRYKRKLILKQYEALNSKEREYIDHRVNYYCKIPNSIVLADIHEQLPNGNAPKVKKLCEHTFQNKTGNTVYFFDTYEYTRYFPQNLKWLHLAGDVFYKLPAPAITKSRLIPAAGEYANEIIINQDNESETATYYASDYAAPTVYTIQTVSVESGKTFAQVSKDKADEVLRKSDFDNLIELTYRESDKIIPAMQIGQPVRVLKKGVGYHTVLTGITSKGDLKTYVFGGIRVDLTKILKLKGAI